MLTIKEIANIINGKMIDVNTQNENNVIDDFEMFFGLIKSKQTAYFSPNKNTWSRFLGRSKGSPEGNELIDPAHEEIGLIISEEEAKGLHHPIPQIIVEDSVKALKTLAIHIRNQYTNPIIAVTGSMGKSSTRMLISSLLQDYEVLENRGNNNVRAATYINMLKLIKNPDFAVIETSLNAINYIEDTMLNLRPDISIITGIGAAHFSSFKSMEEIAKIKSRVFNGLSKDGIAIINGDTLFADYLVEQASTHTKNVYTYSTLTSSSADLTPEFIQYQKGFVRFGILNGPKFDMYQINTISSGMVSNTLAALLVLKQLNIDIHADYLKDFQPFSKVLKMKTVKTPHHQLTLLDDTHNASLPAMINAIQAFDTQTRFFKGNKIIALGKINDLGKNSREIHQELAPVLAASNADYILCLDDDLRHAMGNVRKKHVTWYASTDMMLNDLKFLCNEDSLTLLKSSSGGTAFPELAKQLPNVLASNNIQYEDTNLFDEMRRLGRSYLIVDNTTHKIETAVNAEHSMTIDGLGPLIYYTYAANEHVPNTTRAIKEWRTNNNIFYTGREMTNYELLKHISDSPHPSVIYELADRLFEKAANRNKYIRAFIEKYDLDPSVAVNLTGRFMMRERQCYSVHDLYKIFKDYQYELFRFNNTFIIGDDSKSGYIRGRNQTIIFTSYDNPEDLKSLITF
ncbi:Mur ligase family protein [Staphylococcus americanisciuri]|uniref:Mur ligase family protein n=1 Tax=Staphylococcus americanisciuri TaxID=2973940 RepID=A0ABT2F188_9STAP|nr:Mur ligase family protein [Staphylococcus americanisciuri]MCS4486219.1 Mur ligase family protein [Staphylococcus americanisciuri]